MKGVNAQDGNAIQIKIQIIYNENLSFNTFAAKKISHH